MSHRLHVSAVRGVVWQTLSHSLIVPIPFAGAGIIYSLFSVLLFYALEVLPLPKKKYNHYFLRYPVTVTVKTDPNAYLNAPSVTICPLARLSCRRLASAMLQESPDGESTKMAVNLFRTQNSPDTNVDSEGGQEVPNTSSRYNILRQLFKVAKCCQTLRETNISQENVGILGCSGFEGGNGIEVSITVWYVCYSYSC